MANHYVTSIVALALLAGLLLEIPTGSIPLKDVPVTFIIQISVTTLEL